MLDDMRLVAKILAGIILLYGLFLGGLAIAMRQPPDTFGAIMAKMPPIAFMIIPFQTLWFSARAGKLQVGDAASDFSLKPLDGGAEVRLSSFRGKRPVVLVFGSYT
jgi:hypothetical protein